MVNQVLSHDVSPIKMMTVSFFFPIDMEYGNYGKSLERGGAAYSFAITVIKDMTHVAGFNLLDLA